MRILQFLMNLGIAEMAQNRFKMRIAGHIFVFLQVSIRTAG